MDWEESVIITVLGILSVLHIGIKIRQFSWAFLAHSDRLEDPEQPKLFWRLEVSYSHVLSLVTCAVCLRRLYPEKVELEATVTAHGRSF